MYGHTKKLLVLPFDHRGSFAKGLFGADTPDEATVAKIKEYKHLIYTAIFETQRSLGLPLDSFAVLVDEFYGDEILHDARSKGIQTMQSVEKSGMEEFVFEYGTDFGTHLVDDDATFAKALVRYNPDGNEEHNVVSRENLKELSDFCHSHNIKLLIEPLIPPTEDQLEKVDGDKKMFDAELRPKLTIRMIRELQEAGVECDIWKIEGFAAKEHYKAVVAAARNTEERQGVGVIILGRGETKARVQEWLLAGKDVPGVIGFAVGRTIFWEPLVDYRDGKVTKEEVIQKISDEFSSFCNLFLK